MVVEGELMSRIDKERYLTDYIKVVTEENKQLKWASKKYKHLGSKYQSVIDYKLHLNSIRTTLLLQKLHQLRYPDRTNPHNYKKSSTTNNSCYIEPSDRAKLHIWEIPWNV